MKEKEIEYLRIKLEVQKLNAQMEFSQMQQSSSVYLALIVGVSFPISFYSLIYFFISFCLFTIVFLASLYKKNMRKNLYVQRVFAIGNLISKKLDINLLRLNKELNDLEDKINRGKTFEV